MKELKKGVSYEGIRYAVSYPNWENFDTSVVRLGIIDSEGFRAVSVNGDDVPDFSMSIQRLNGNSKGTEDIDTKFIAEGVKNAMAKVSSGEIGFDWFEGRFGEDSFAYLDKEYVFNEQTFQSKDPKTVARTVLSEPRLCRQFFYNIKKEQERIDALKNTKTRKKTNIPDVLNIEELAGKVYVPMPHQSAIVDWVKEKGFSRVLLEWEMGTGKTLAGKLIADHWNDETKLVICPKSLVNMWVDFLSSNTEEPVTDLTTDEYRKAPQGPLRGWYVINYDLLANRPYVKGDDYHRSIFKNSTLILDESSYIKYPQPKRTKIVMNGIAPDMNHICMLSGTPCGGHYELLWTHARLLGRKMSEWEFMENYTNRHEIVLKNNYGVTVKTNNSQNEFELDEYGIPIEPNNRLKDKERKIKVLNKNNPYKMDNIVNILLPDMNSKGRNVLKAKDCISLPEITNMTIAVDKPQTYSQFIKNNTICIDRKNLNSTTENGSNTRTFNGDSIMATRQALRQIASSYNENKLDAVRDIIEGTDERIVIFYNFQEDYEKILDICTKAERPVAAMNGSRKDLASPGNAYETRDNSICLVQWQSGGYGLNLQKARIGVFFSLTESYELFSQACGRIYRKGQEKPVVYVSLITKGSIDEKIKRSLDKREDYNDEKFIDDFPEYAALPKYIPETEKKEIKKDFGKEKGKNLLKTKEEEYPSLFDF